MPAPQRELIQFSITLASLSLSLCFLFIVHFSHVYFSREALTQKWSRRSFPDMLLRSFVCAHKDKRASRIKSDSVSASRDEPRGSNSTFLAPGKHPHTHPRVLCQPGIGGVTRLFACMSWNKFTPPQNSGCDGGWNQPASLRLANMWKHIHTLSLFIVGGEMKTKLKPPPPPISPLSSGPEIVVCVSKSERNTVLRAHKHTHSWTN